MDNQSAAQEVQKPYTLEDYLLDKVNFNVPVGAITAICKDRKADQSKVYPDECSDYNVRLLYADVLKWIVLGAGRVGATKDSDNGWSHSDGSYTLSDADKKRLINEANQIYEEEGELDSKFGKTKIRMRSHGIMSANYGLDGRPLPHIIK